VVEAGHAGNDGSDGRLAEGMKCIKMVMFICSKGRTQSIKTCCHGQEHMPPECGENLDIRTELCSLYHT
jgi:hypothetical protein